MLARRSGTLTVENLKVYYDTPEGVVKAVDGVSFVLKPGERLALVGESGSGKSTLAMALMRLTRAPGRIVSGHIYLDDIDLLQLDQQGIRDHRLRDIALIPQGAMNSLNPVMRVGDQIVDGIVDHLPESESAPSRAELDERVRTLLGRVGLTPQVGRMFPHELSGGMKQRVAMAIAISLDPAVIVADEPTSALDVVVQRQIMQTLGQLQEGLAAAVVLIGHDMGLVAQFAHRVGVMYAGKLVELAPVRQVFRDALHPYTRLLIQSLPNLESKKKFLGIPGLPPTLLHLPPGCVFHPRCPAVIKGQCETVVPVWGKVRDDQLVACHLYPEAKR
jgi:peptide/nickel transport system ATP-binding protein